MTVLGKAQRFLLNDEERGKKDDDHKPSTLNRGLRNPGWYPNRVPQRRSLKRVAVVIVVAALVFLFIYNIPTDLGPVRTARPNYGAGTRKPAGSYATSSSAAAENNGSPVATYTGPPKFLELASSLHAIAGTRGGMLINKNVLFATSSLKSAAILLPIACQMGRETRNYVHFALMSRSEIDIEELRSINGIDESCQIIFHDARAEKAAIMSDDRMEYAVFRAFHHIFMWMHPQAIIIDGSGWEEYFLTKAATTHVKATGNTLIELPYAVHDLLWLTKLDSRSLRGMCFRINVCNNVLNSTAWNQNHVDILIQAVPGTTGSLIRLLRSLSAADFLSNSIPHLTIELPTDVDAATKSFLAGFQWPPSHVSDAAGANYLSLRHRIPRQRLAEEEASTRFLESFWPVDPKTSHVLVLSPQVELTPNFFHCK